MSEELHSAFTSFASYGKGAGTNETQMDGKNFAKLCKDSGLVSKNLTTVDIDIIFSKVKAKGGRKISFPEFQQACEHLATKKGIPVKDLEHKILQAGGPKTQATKADYVKFHDDKSTYTGVYAAGGPTNVDGNKDLSSLADRSPANVRGIPASFAKSH